MLERGITQIYSSNKAQLLASHIRVSHNEILMSSYKEHNERLFKYILSRLVGGHITRLFEKVFYYLVDTNYLIS